MFAIQNIKTGDFVYGTDFRYSPPHQRTSNRQMLTFPTLHSACHAFLVRKCGRDYRVVCLKTVQVKAVYSAPKTIDDAWNLKVIRIGLENNQK